MQRSWSSRGELKRLPVPASRVFHVKIISRSSFLEIVCSRSVNFPLYFFNRKAATVTFKLLMCCDSSAVSPLKKSAAERHDNTWRVLESRSKPEHVRSHARPYDHAYALVPTNQNAGRRSLLLPFSPCAQSACSHRVCRRCSASHLLPPRRHSVSTSPSSCTPAVAAAPTCSTAALLAPTSRAFISPAAAHAHGEAACTGARAAATQVPRRRREAAAAFTTRHSPRDESSEGRRTALEV